MNFEDYHHFQDGFQEATAYVVMTAQLLLVESVSMGIDLKFCTMYTFLNVHILNKFCNVCTHPHI